MTDKERKETTNLLSQRINTTMNMSFGLFELLAVSITNANILHTAMDCFVMVFKAP
jgi:hypothetical protein